MNPTTPITPAQAACEMYNAIPYRDETIWDHVSKAAIEAHLATVAESLPTEEEIARAIWLDPQASGGSATPVLGLFTPIVAKLQAERDELKKRLAQERDDKLTAIELVNKRGEQLRSIIEVLEKLGRNGVENSKIASVFLTDYVEDMMATFAKDISERDAAIADLNARLIDRTNESLRKLEEKTKRERYVPLEEHEEMKRVAVEALEAVLTTNHGNPVLTYQGMEDVANKALTKLKGVEQ